MNEDCSRGRTEAEKRGGGFGRDSHSGNSLGTPRCFLQRVRKRLERWEINFARAKEGERVRQERKKETRGTDAWAELLPHLPGHSDDYQKKGVAGGAIWMNVKRKELEKLGQPSGEWRSLGTAQGKEKWGRKLRMEAS